MERSGNSIIRVKVSPEEAGGIGASRVVLRDVPLQQLVEWIVSVTGKDAERIETILARGVFVKSLSRLRWEPIADSAGVAAILDELPSDLPDRAIEHRYVIQVVVSAGRKQIVIPGNVARAKRWFRGSSFLDALLGDTVLPAPVYQRYDYEAKADQFAAGLTHTAHGAFDALVELLPARSLRGALRGSAPHRIALYLERGRSV